MLTTFVYRMHNIFHNNLSLDDSISTSVYLTNV